MALSTRSAFIYGHNIDDNNQFINFTENGIDELAATIEVGSYTMGEFVNKIAQALNDIGDNTYEVTVDRPSRTITISADANFDLLVTTGTQSTISAFSLIGFTSDKSGTNSYVADTSTGSIYYPQYKLQSYIDFNDIEEAVQAKVNESSSGVIEVVSYGTKNLMECVITYATDIERSCKGETSGIENQLNGVANLRSFLQYLRQKRPIEFIPDRDNLELFEKCLLESAEGYSNGTGFKLKELYAQGLAYHFSSGKLRFRRIE